MYTVMDSFALGVAGTVLVAMTGLESPLKDGGRVLGSCTCRDGQGDSAAEGRLVDDSPSQYHISMS